MTVDTLHKFRDIAYALRMIQSNIKQLGVLAKNIEHMYTSLYEEIEDKTGDTGKLSELIKPLNEGEVTVEEPSLTTGIL